MNRMPTGLIAAISSGTTRLSPLAFVPLTDPAPITAARSPDPGVPLRRAAAEGVSPTDAAPGLQPSAHESPIGPEQ